MNETERHRIQTNKCDWIEQKKKKKRAEHIVHMIYFDKRKERERKREGMKKITK